MMQPPPQGGVWDRRNSVPSKWVPTVGLVAATTEFRLAPPVGAETVLTTTGVGRLLGSVGCRREDFWEALHCVRGSGYSILGNF